MFKEFEKKDNNIDEKQTTNTEDVHDKIPSDTVSHHNQSEHTIPENDQNINEKDNNQNQLNQQEKEKIQLKINDIQKNNRDIEDEIADSMLMIDTIKDGFHLDLGSTD